MACFLEWLADVPPSRRTPQCVACQTRLVEVGYDIRLCLQPVKWDPVGYLSVCLSVCRQRACSLPDSICHVCGVQIMCAASTSYFPPFTSCLAHALGLLYVGGKKTDLLFSFCWLISAHLFSYYFCKRTLEGMSCRGCVKACSGLGKPIFYASNPQMFVLKPDAKRWCSQAKRIYWPCFMCLTHTDA